ncbi:MAG TPA: D-glycerate dehydrogenase [Haliangiales bacterium]|nr:D-glycerate dehydrogenase [Haliangiales bacterium]
MAKVVATSAFPIDLRPLLGAGIELVEGSLADATDAEGLICLLRDRIDDAFLARAPRLRVVANYAVGVDNVDVAACARRGVAVTNTPDVLTDATADLTFALILAVARRLREAEALLRSGRWGSFEPGLLLGVELSGATLGLVGAGRIARAVARRADGFGMSVVYTSRRSELPGARRRSLDELLGEADFVSLHCPLTPETRGLIGAAQLRRMKPTAFLINTARGAICDEEAVAAALAAGTIAGAGLDAFVDEPRVVPALLAAPNAVLLPHIGSATRKTRSRMAELCALGVREVLAGRRPPNLVVPGERAVAREGATSSEAQPSEVERPSHGERTK